MIYLAVDRGFRHCDWFPLGSSRSLDACKRPRPRRPSEVFCASCIDPLFWRLNLGQLCLEYMELHLSTFELEMLPYGRLQRSRLELRGGCRNLKCANQRRLSFVQDSAWSASLLHEIWNHDWLEAWCGSVFEPHRHRLERRRKWRAGNPWGLSNKSRITRGLYTF